MRDAAAVEQAIEQSRPDAIIHLAAIAHRSDSYRGDYDTINRAATVNLVKACRHQNIKRLIFRTLYFN